MSSTSLTASQLRAIYGEPRTLVAEAWASSLEATTRTFIEASPFVLLSSTNAEGLLI